MGRVQTELVEPKMAAKEYDAENTDEEDERSTSHLID